MYVEKAVLIVDSWDGWRGEAPIKFPDSADATIHVVETIGEAGRFFNGKATAQVLVVGDVPGVSDFVRDVRGRFEDVCIIGLAEHQLALANIGCNCFASRESVPLSAHVFLNR